MGMDVGAFVGEGVAADVGALVGALVGGGALGERPVRKGRMTDICAASVPPTGSIH